MSNHAFREVSHDLFVKQALLNSVICPDKVDMGSVYQGNIASTQRIQLQLPSACCSCLGQRMAIDRTHHSPVTPHFTWNQCHDCPSMTPHLSRCRQTGHCVLSLKRMCLSHLPFMSAAPLPLQCKRVPWAWAWTPSWVTENARRFGWRRIKICSRLKLQQTYLMEPRHEQ